MQKALSKILKHWKWLSKSTVAAISTLEATHGINFPEEADVNDKVKLHSMNPCELSNAKIYKMDIKV